MRDEKILRCNGCGKEIKNADGMLREGIFCGEQEWGYFSRKDGERHFFCLCEDCYDKIRQSFAIPVTVETYI